MSIFYPWINCWESVAFNIAHNGFVYLSVVGISEMKIVKRNDFDAPASVSAGHRTAIEDKRC